MSDGGAMDWPRIRHVATRAAARVVSWDLAEDCAHDAITLHLVAGDLEPAHIVQRAFRMAQSIRCGATRYHRWREVPLHNDCEDVGGETWESTHDAIDPSVEDLVETREAATRGLARLAAKRPLYASTIAALVDHGFEAPEALGIPPTRWQHRLSEARDAFADAYGCARPRAGVRGQVHTQYVRTCSGIERRSGEHQ